MAYIGREPQVGNFQVCDAISVVNGQAAYTMQVSSVNVSPETANHMIVSLNGVLQKPGSSYTVSGSTITFASNLVTGDVIDFIHILGSVLDLGVPSNDTVGAAQIKDDLISGSTELASEPADTDEFLVSDAGTLKRIDYSLIKGGGITEADQWRLSANFTSSAGTGFITSNWERNDTTGFAKIGTGLTESSGVFSFASTGIYKIELSMMAYGDGGARFYWGNGIQTTVNNSSYTSSSMSYESSYTNAAYGTLYTAFIFDVTDTSTHKFKIFFETAGSSTIWESSSTRQSNNLTITRLGDT